MPSDLQTMSREELVALAEEQRAEIALRVKLINILVRIGRDLHRNVVVRQQSINLTIQSLMEKRGKAGVANVIAALKELPSEFPEIDWPPTDEGKKLPDSLLQILDKYK